MTTYKILLEALSINQINYVDNKLGGKKYNPSEEHGFIFGEGVNRIKIPYNHSHEENPIKDSIRYYINGIGYDIEDYKNGLASREYIDKIGNKRKKIIKIGKLLQENGENDLLKKFTYDPFRSNENTNHEITLTRDKYDIAGMTSGRDWENQSCMKLPNDSSEGGSNYDRIKDDLKNHTLVAYLTKKGDDEIEAPLGRVLIKKYKSKKKIDGKYHYVWRPDIRVYGNVPEGFLTSVKNYMAEKYPMVENNGYSLASGLYPEQEHDYLYPIQRGLVKNKNITNYFDEHGELNDYVEDGINKPAVYDEKNGQYAHYKHGKLHMDKDEPSSTIKGIISYHKHGMLHRDSDEPSVIDNSNNSLEYYKYGLLHRPYGNPAKIIDNDNEKEFLYSEYGVTHREGDEPAHVHVVKGKFKIKKYAIRGEYHRDIDKPSIVEKSYTPYGISSTYKYYKNGKIHREGKPAVIKHILKNGILTTEHEYYENGKIHRGEGKPSIIKIVKDSNGNIIRNEQSFIENGSFIQGYDKPIKIKRGNLEEYEINGNDMLKGNITHKIYNTNYHGESVLPTEKFYKDGELIKTLYHHNSPSLPILEEKFKDGTCKKYNDKSYRIDYNNGNDYVEGKHYKVKYYSMLEELSNLHNFRSYVGNQGRGNTLHMIHFDHNGKHYRYDHIDGRVDVLQDGKLINSKNLESKIELPTAYNKENINNLVHNISKLRYNKPNEYLYNRASDNLASAVEMFNKPEILR